MFWLIPFFLDNSVSLETWEFPYDRAQWSYHEKKKQFNWQLLVCSLATTWPLHLSLNCGIAIKCHSPYAFALNFLDQVCVSLMLTGRGLYKASSINKRDDGRRFQSPQLS